MSAKDKKSAPAKAKTKAASAPVGKKSAGKVSAKPQNSPPAPPSQPATSQGAAEKRFVNDVLVRGEAAPLAPDGKLPLNATHILEKQNDDGSAVIKRARFKLF
jgi:hypothetical protein